MVTEWKFRDVVDRADLDQQTAQYVLKHPEFLSGMPEGGTQGVHRRFSTAQAVRLAICTYLVKQGVPLSLAGDVVGYCERRVRQLGPNNPPKDRQYYSAISDPWLLEIVDCKFARLWREAVGHLWDEEAYYVILDGSETTYPRTVHFTRAEINLTHIEQRLRTR